MQKCHILHSPIDLKKFRSQHDAFKEKYRLEKGRKRKQKSRIRLIEKRGSEQAQENMWKSKSRAKLVKERGTKITQAQQNKWESKSRTKLIKEKGANTVQAQENKRKFKSRNSLWLGNFTNTFSNLE